METIVLRSLLAPAGQQALQDAESLSPREGTFLSHFTALSKLYPSEIARAALEIAIQRQDAAHKFPFAGKLYFTREALEQATPWEISIYRARRYKDSMHILDLGCSVGSDTMALAQVAPATGVDRDPLRLAMALANARALGLSGRVGFICADLTASLPLSPPPSKTALFFDPARRQRARRQFTVRQYQPPLEIIRDWLPVYPSLGVKVSPGVNLEELRTYDCEIEFISLRGELKEASLWFGPLKSASRRATILPGAHSLTEEDNPPERLPLGEPRAFLYEPDPALLRAGLVAALGVQLEAAQLDADIAYLTSDRQVDTPYARLWAVQDWFPFQLKRLRLYLRQHGIGRVIVKKRGSPLQPQELISALRLSGDQECTLFLTHLRGKPIVVIGSQD